MMFRRNVLGEDNVRIVRMTNFAAVALLLTASAVLAAISFFSSMPGSSLEQRAFAIGGIIDGATCENSFGGNWDGVHTCTISSNLSVNSGQNLEIAAGVHVVIPSGVSLNINNDSHLNVPQDATLTIDAGGTLHNSGKIDNLGNIANNGIISNDGDIFNNYDFGIVAGAISNAGTINNNSGGGITNNGLIENFGGIENNGDVSLDLQGVLNIQADSVLNVNPGGFVNVKDTGVLNIVNSGALDARGGTVTVIGGDINIDSAGSLFVNNGGKLLLNDLGAIQAYHDSIIEIQGGIIYLGSSSNGYGRISLDASTLSIKSGGVVNINGGVLSGYNQWAKIDVLSGGIVNINPGGLGGLLQVTSDGSLNVNDGGTVNVNDGRILSTVGGFVGVNSGGVVNVYNSGNLGVGTDGNVYVNQGGIVNVYSGGSLTAAFAWLVFYQGTVNMYCGAIYSEHDSHVAGTLNYIPCDNDSDGIVDSIDTQPGIFSNNFSDGGPGTLTVGTITSRGGQIVHVIDASYPKGVLASADPSGTGSSATIKACGGIADYTLQPGAKFVITCGSATTEVIQGPVSVKFFTADGSTFVASANIATGNTLTYEPTTKSFTADPNNTSSTAVTLANGNIVTVGAGETKQLWTLNGFYQPVDKLPTYNTLKSGQAVPIKWNVMAGTTEITDTTKMTMKQHPIACSTTSPVDAVEEFVSAGQSSLTYDPVAHQFKYVWKSPSNSAGSCFQVTLTSADGSTLSAWFKLTK